MNPVNSPEKSLSAVAHRFAVSDAEQQTVELLPAKWSNSLQEMICAAAISPHFCHSLLFEPDVALAQGFNGQRFVLTPQELHLIRSIRAASLEELIEELYNRSILEEA